MGTFQWIATLRYPTRFEIMATQLGSDELFKVRVDGPCEDPSTGGFHEFVLTWFVLACAGLHAWRACVCVLVRSRFGSVGAVGSEGRAG